MQEYAATLLSVLAFSALASMLSPKGKGEKGVRFALSLLLMFAILSPLFGGELFERWQSGAYLDEMVSQSEEGAEAGNAYYADAQKKAVAEILAEGLSRDFGVKREELSLDLTLSYDETRAQYTVKEIKLHLYGKACLADAHGMQSTIRQETGADCEVIYHRA